MKLRGVDKAKENYFTLNPDFLVSILTNLFLSSSSSLPSPTDTEQYKYAADAQENMSPLKYCWPCAVSLCLAAHQS